MPDEELVLDTDVVSYLFKRDTRASLYESRIADRQCLISFATLAELDLWAVVHNWGPARRNRLDQHIEQFTIVYPDRILCSWWAEVTARARRHGRPIAPHDAWIAATALAMGLTLVTNNPGDYSVVKGLSLITEAPQ